MASNYTALGVQLMTTGEKAGLWGGLTNTNWNIIEQISGGYLAVDINGGAQTTTLSVSDGSTGAALAHRVIEFTGAITGNQIVTIPLDVQTFYIIKNTTSDGSDTYTVQFKYVSGSGDSVTWAGGDRGTKIIYATANDGTNPDIADATSAFVTASSTTTLTNKSIDLGNNTLSGSLAEFNTALQSESFASLTGAETLTNKTLTSPKFASGGFIADAGGDENLVFTEVGTPVNELRITNAATGSGPILAAISTSSTDSNIDLNINPLGTGVLKSGSAAVKVAGTETIFVPAAAMFGTTTNGADAQAVETTATRPELKVLDFDASTAEYAQFSIAMPKSWNLGTVTYQVFWSPSNTDTGDAIFGLQGLATTEGDTADAAFGTAIEVTDAGIGTVEDVQVTAVSSAMTIAGSPADDDYTFFQLYRDAADGSDTFTGDARVLGIKLFYTTDAANDA